MTEMQLDRKAAVSLHRLSSLKWGVAKGTQRGNFRYSWQGVIAGSGFVPGSNADLTPSFLEKVWVL